MSVVIIFNPINPDSILAAQILRDSIVTADYDGIQEEIFLIPHQRTERLQKFSCRVCYALAANLTMQDIDNLDVRGSIKIIDYSESESFQNTIGISWQHPFMVGKNVEDVFDKSISKMVLYGLDESVLQEMNLKYGQIADVVFKYVNFIKMSELELKIYYSFIDSINTSTGEFSNLQQSPLCELSKQPILQKVRKIITRNTDKQVFGDSNKNKILPAVNIAQESFYDAGRQIQHAHDSFVMYEDMKGVRLWCVFSKDIKVAISMIDMIDNHDWWIDNNFVYMLSEIPKFSK